MVRRVRVLRQRQLAVQALSVLQQGVVAARLNHAPTINDRNDVSVLDRAQPVCHQDDGHRIGPCFARLDQSLNGLSDHLLALAVQGAGGLVQQQDAGVPDDCACNGDPLLLAAAQLAATLPRKRGVACSRAMRKHHYIIYILGFITHTTARSATK